MSSRTVVALPPQRDLKQVFEQAVGELQPERKRAIVSQRRPIVQRGVAIAPLTPMETEKRALKDAARALAQLWKVSPNPAR